MADKTVRGRFVWHELITPDTTGAHSFYSKALGWKTQSWEHDPSYSMFAAASGPLAGSVAQPSGTPHWLSYIATADIDATVQQATSLGGRVIKEITGLPTGGKYALLADPQGAQFGVYWSQTHSPESPPKRGEFSWHELATTDYKAAFQFYSALFGWDKTDEHDMGPIGVYLIFGRNGRPVGGIFNKPAEMQGPPAWCAYVRVKDVNQIAKKVKSVRGTLINGPMEVPGGDWIAQFLDPYGALFAVHALAADMKAAEAPAAAATAEPEPPAVQAAAVATQPKAPKKAAKKPVAARKKAAPKKKAASRKAAPRKKAAAKKKRPAAKSAKRPARKTAKVAKKAGKKKATAKRSSSRGKKKAAKRPRKGK